MNKAELLNTNNITNIQKSLSECLSNGTDAVRPCIEFFKIPKEYRSDTAVEMVVTVLQTFKSFVSFLNIAYEHDLMQVLRGFAKNSYNNHITRQTVLIRSGDIDNAFYLILNGKAIELSVHIEKKFLTTHEYVSHLVKLHVLNEKKLFKDTIQLNKHLLPHLTPSISEWKWKLRSTLNINVPEMIRSTSQFIRDTHMKYTDVIQPQALTAHDDACCYDITSKAQSMKYLFQLPLYHTQHVLHTGDVIGSLVRTKLCKAQSTYIVNEANVVCINKFEDDPYVNDLFSIVSENTKLQCERVYCSFHVFQDIPMDEFKQEIAKYFAYKQVKNNDYIIKQDSYSDNVFFILSGTFSVTSYRSLREVNQLIADLQNSLDNFNTNRFISSYMNKAQTRRTVHRAFECENYSSNPVYKSSGFTSKSKERKDILIFTSSKRSVFGLSDFYNKHNELYHFNVKCTSDNGGDMFYVSKDVFNSIMKRYHCIMDKCGKLIEERVRYYTLQLSKYKETFVKSVECIGSPSVANKNKWCLRKASGNYHSNIRLSMLNVHKRCRAVSGVSFANYSCNNTNHSFAASSAYDGSFERKRRLGKNPSTASSSTMYGSTSCLYDKKWFSVNRDILFRPRSQKHFGLVKQKPNNKFMLKHAVKEQLDASSSHNKGSVSLREKNISQINFNIE